MIYKRKFNRKRIKLKRKRKNDIKERENKRCVQNHNKEDKKMKKVKDPVSRLFSFNRNSFSDSRISSFNCIFCSLWRRGMGCSIFYYFWSSTCVTVSF